MRRSRGVTSVIALPVRPARPVRRVDVLTSELSVQHVAKLEAEYEALVTERFPRLRSSDPERVSLSYLNNFAHLEQTGQAQAITYR